MVGIIARCELSETKVPLNVVHEYERSAVIKSGGIPILILPPQSVIYNEQVPREMSRLTTEEKEDLKRQIDLCDGILLPGGDKMYEFDRFIMEYIIQENKPVLGICMGMQIMCTYNKKIQLDLNDRLIQHFTLKQKAHKVYIDAGTKLYDICSAEEIMVNSRHKRHVIDSNDFRVCARSLDGAIEAVEGIGNIFQLGVQWHPELDIEKNDVSRKIFHAFISSML